MAPLQRYDLPRWVKPKYDELSLFLMSTALLLLFFDPEFRREAIQYVRSCHDVRDYLLLVVFLGGFCLSLFHVFTAGPATDFQKMLMLIFAVFANGFSGILAGMDMWHDSHGILLVFPIWNIVSGAMLLISWRCDIVDESCIEDTKSTLLQTLLGIIVLTATFMVCHLFFDLRWSLTYSICVAYSTTVNDQLKRLVGRLKNAA